MRKVVGSELHTAFKIYYNKQQFEEENKYKHPIEVKVGQEYDEYEEDQKTNRKFYCMETKIMTMDGPHYYVVKREIYSKEMLQKLSIYCNCNKCKKSKMYSFNIMRLFLKDNETGCIKDGTGFSYQLEYARNRLQKDLKNKK